MRGDLKELQRLLKENPDLARNPGDIPHWEATGAGQTRVVEFFLKDGYIKDPTLVLRNALKLSKFDIAEVAIRHGADVNYSYKSTSQGSGAAGSHRVYISSGGTSYGTVLTECVTKGNLEAVRFLLNHKADVNLADEGGQTPLYWANRLADEGAPRGYYNAPSKETYAGIRDFLKSQGAKEGRLKWKTR